MEWGALLFVFIIGLIFGSFMNVLVRRIPEGKSIMTRSVCPLCQRPVRWSSNIPVISYLLQKGKCRDCGGRISLMYPLVELCTAFLFCLIFLRSDSTILAVKNSLFMFLMLAAAFTDMYTALSGKFKSGMIPDVYTIGGVLCGYIGALYTEPGFLYALAGSGAGYFIIMIPAFIYTAVRKTEGIGEGDALLLAMAGSFLGPHALPFIVLVSALVGIVAGAAVIGYTKNRHYKIPFAPAIALASALWFVAGDWFYTVIG